MTKSLIFLAFLLKSCALNSSDTKEKSVELKKEYFEDLNLFTMEGVKKIEKAPTYPYIEVEKVSDTKKTIVYHGTKDMVYRMDYNKMNDLWVTSYTSNGDTCSIITYEYVTPDKVVDLYYCYNDNINDTVLTDVAVYESSTEVKYDMGNERNVVPGINVVDLAKARCKSTFTRNVSIQDDLLVLKEKRVDNNNQILSEGTNCYELGKHSYFWWRYFGWLTKKIDCK